jgi:hypothetical protein
VIAEMKPYVPPPRTLPVPAGYTLPTPRGPAATPPPPPPPAGTLPLATPLPPAGTLPPATLPPATLPPATLPPGTLPAGTLPPATPPPAGPLPADLLGPATPPGRPAWPGRAGLAVGAVVGAVVAVAVTSVVTSRPAAPPASRPPAAAPASVSAPVSAGPPAPAGAGRPAGSTQPAGTTAAPPVVASTPPRPTEPAQALALTDPLAGRELSRQVAEDAAGIAGLAGRWVPQVSSKCVGVSVDVGPNWIPDGRSETAHVSVRQILAFHLSLRSRFGARTVLPRQLGIARDAPESGPCAHRPVWMSVVPEPFDTAADANSWCAGNVPPVRECQARYVAPPGERSTTVPRG